MEITASKFRRNTERANVGPLFWTIVGVVVGVLSLVGTGVAIGVSVNQYNHRYDSNATAAGGLEFTLQNKDQLNQSFTCSAGELTYGYFQKSGTTNTSYELKYKETSDSTFKTLKSEFTIYKNNDYYGEYAFKNNKYSSSFDIKLVKKNNKTSKTVFEFDWGIK